MFEWDDLRHFLAVARHSSTIAAAKSLGLSQSTVHRRLAELEKRIGRPVVIRHPTGYRLTEFGLDAHVLRERFAHYTDTFNIDLEHLARATGTGALA